MPFLLEALEARDFFADPDDRWEAIEVYDDLCDLCDIRSYAGLAGVLERFRRLPALAGPQRDRRPLARMGEFLAAGMWLKLALAPVAGRRWDRARAPRQARRAPHEHADLRRVDPDHDGRRSMSR